VRQACAQDLLFYLNGFAFTFDPRLDEKGLPSEVPFVAYPFQEEVLRTLAEKLGKEDLLIEKSRDQGASWMCLYAMAWKWKFKRGQKFFLMSRSEDLVDKTSDLDALFPKLDYLERFMPPWLQVKTVRNHMLMHNAEMNSTFTGAATTGRSGAGGRMTAALVDEFALFDVTLGFQSLQSLQHATKSRIFNSTPRGQIGAYYEVRQKMVQVKPQNVITLHWSKHPVQAKGLYKPRTEGGWDVIDKAGLPVEYKLRSEVPKGPWKLRSPWYDNECDRTPVPSQIAQELDIDYVGSGASFFDPGVIEGLLSGPKYTVRPPTACGDLDFDSETLDPKAFVILGNGRLRTWLPLVDGMVCPVPDRKYVVACDVALGTGSSDSALSVVDRFTGEKVASYANANIGQHEYADFAVALAKWFNGAYLIWEKNGPGLVFGKQVLKRRYSPIHYRKDELKVGASPGDVPGWHSNKETKNLLLSRYQLKLARGEFINREAESLQQCKEYVWFGDKIVHQSVRTSDEETEDQHGDRVIADAMAAWIIDTRPTKPPEAENPKPKYGTFEWLEGIYEKRDQLALAQAEEW
jgi:hypothetical protein